MTVSGVGFTGASTVDFNGTSAAFVATSASSLTATVPTGATSGPIVVTTPLGTATSLAPFTVLVPPKLTKFSPASAPVGLPVTLTGSGLTGALSVTFNGASAPFVVVSPTTITTQAPPGATFGTIAVTSPGGTATTSKAFKIKPPPKPKIKSFLPLAGGIGTTISVTGSGFTGATALRFNGVPATYLVVSDVLITTQVPSGASNGKIAVVTGAGTATSSKVFTVS